MRRKRRYWILGVIGVALLLVTGGDLPANHFGVAQYWAVSYRGSGAREVKVYNPTDAEMFALLIEFNDESSFPRCTGLFVDPGSFNIFLNRLGDGEHRIEDRAYVEVLAFSTEGAGKFKTRDHNLGVHVVRGTRGLPFVAGDATAFKPGTGVKACACAVLKDFGLPRTALSAFHLGC